MQVAGHYALPEDVLYVGYLQTIVFIWAFTVHRRAKKADMKVM